MEGLVYSCCKHIDNQSSVQRLWTHEQAMCLFDHSASRLLT